jgi:ribosomal-protein-alanine N-acetyltransferase
MVWLNAIAMTPPVNQVRRRTARTPVQYEDMEDVLTGQRVLLRRPRLDDAEELFERVTSDPQVSKYMSWQPHPDVDETRRVITELFNVGEDHTWLVVLCGTREVIGAIGYQRPAPHAVSFGYYLSRQFWGRGLMSEAVGLLLHWLQQDSRIYRVSAACHVDNTRSARVLERCGLSLEGRLARYLVLPNLGPEPQDCLLYARSMR